MANVESNDERKNALIAAEDEVRQRVTGVSHDRGRVMGDYEIGRMRSLYSQHASDPRQETLILTETVTTMSKAIMQQTYNFEALHDKELAEHFLNAGKHLSGEVEVLGSAIRCIMLTGDNLSNKEIILQLIHALEITEEPEACDVIRNTLEIVVGFTRDDI